MEKLKGITTDSSTLARGLQKMGESHVNYKIYTSIANAINTINTGALILSNGSHWNDVKDRELMEKNQAYAKCLSYSTRENIAMWMLYSAEHGKKGAMLCLPNSIIRTLLQTDSIELGQYKKGAINNFVFYDQLNKKDFEIYLTDVIYTDYCKDNQVKLTHEDQHITVKQTVLNDEKKIIFYKNYAWAYERECRLVIKLSDKYQKKAKKEKLTQIRITIPKETLKSVKDKLLVRSPIFSGKEKVGVQSSLTGEVDWNL